MAKSHEVHRVSQILRNFEAKLVNSVREMVHEVELEFLSSPPSSTSHTPTLTNSNPLVDGFTSDSELPTPVKLRYAGSTPYPRQWSTPNTESSLRQSSPETYVFQSTALDSYEKCQSAPTSVSKEVDAFPSISLTNIDASSSRSLTPRHDPNSYESDDSLSSSSTRSLTESLKRKIMSDFDEKGRMDKIQPNKRAKTESFDADITPKVSTPPIISTRRILTFKHAFSLPPSSSPSPGTPHFDESSNHNRNDSSHGHTLVVNSTVTSPKVLDFTFSSLMSSISAGAGDLSCLSEGDDDVFGISDGEATNFSNYSWIQDTPSSTDYAVDVDINSEGEINFTTL